MGDTPSKEASVEEVPCGRDFAEGLLNAGEIEWDLNDKVNSRGFVNVVN